MVAAAWFAGGVWLAQPERSRFCERHSPVTPAEVTDGVPGGPIAPAWRCR